MGKLSDETRQAAEEFERVVLDAQAETDASFRRRQEERDRHWKKMQAMFPKWLGK